MIRFVLGMCIVIAGVGAVEGTAPLATGILLSAAGVVVMLWSIKSMAMNGDIDIG